MAVSRKPGYIKICWTEDTRRNKYSTCRHLLTQCIVPPVVAIAIKVGQYREREHAITRNQFARDCRRRQINIFNFDRKLGGGTFRSVRVIIEIGNGGKRSAGTMVIIKGKSPIRQLPNQNKSFSFIALVNAYCMVGDVGRLVCSPVESSHPLTA